MNSDVVFGLENATWPCLVVNPTGGVTLANAAAKKLFPATLDGQSPQLSAIWSPDNTGGAADFLKLWLQSPVPVSSLKFKTNGGASAPFTTAISEFTDAEGKKILFQLLSAAAGGTAPDAKAVTESDAALKQKLDCVLQLARTVSLDFNNALTGVLAHTSLLLGKAEPEHPWRRSLLEVEKSAARAAEIASELAMFSNRQEKEARRTPAGNLNAVASRCVDFFKNAQGARFQWNLTLERGLFESRFDEAKVQQAVTKILENAVEAYPPGATGQIGVRTRNMELTQATQDRNVQLAAGTYVCLEITDSGSGIEAEALPRIFEPFFTTKRAPHRGLGLALVYGIISNHGGGVAISSQPGQGTSARVYLPAEKSRTHDAAPPSQGLRGTGKILVVDDEDLLLTMADTILTDFGYTVLTAGNGQKAMTILAQPETHVDLIITDLVMPGMGGRELIERVRKGGLEVPIICTSGYMLPEDKQHTEGYLQKPFTSTDLLQKVKSVLSS